MGTQPVGRLMISMSLPIMISMLVQALYNIVDSVFVAKVDQDALTAVSLAFPIQTLMIALGKRIDRVPIGLVNNLIFLVVTIVSWMLHAPIGLGTLIAVFGSGLMYQLSYRITRFDPKSVKHESFQDMFAARKS